MNFLNNLVVCLSDLNALFVNLCGKLKLVKNHSLCKYKNIGIEKVFNLKLCKNNEFFETILFVRTDGQTEKNCFCCFKDRLCYALCTQKPPHPLTHTNTHTNTH